jgi:hypothetical protein
VLIEDLVYECCGEVLRVGEHVDLQLTLYGEVVPTDDDEGTDVLGDGRVQLVANPVRFVGEDDGYHENGTRLVAGPVQFGIIGEVTSKVRCTGELQETRHGYPDGATAGTVLSLRRCGAIYKQGGKRVWDVVGYEPGEEVAATDERRPPEPAPPIPAAAPSGSGGRVGRAPFDVGDEVPPDGWAYRVVVGVHAP